MMTLRLILDLKLVASYLLDSRLVDVQELGSILLPQNLWLDTNGTLLLGDLTTRSPRDPSRTLNKGQDVAGSVSNFIYDLTPEIIGISLRPLNPHGLPRLESPNERLSRSLVLRHLATDPSELSQALDLPPRLGDIASSVNGNSYNDNALEAHIASVTERSHTGQFDCDGQWTPGDVLCLSEKGDALKRVGRLPSRQDPLKAISIREERLPRPRVYGIFENSPHAHRDNLPNGWTRYRFAHVGSDVKVISLSALRRIAITQPQEIWSSFRPFAISLAATIDVPVDRLILIVSTQDQVRFAQYTVDRLDDGENKPESMYFFLPSDPAVMPVVAGAGPSKEREN
ncbi:hypothetical protein BS47DRAFT_1056882 [Hydnum rufescens UP504]|uniref:Uncharacterized protein n=1 Tax=Hydnum rufescens UP504 TaxID=1448309 RepID=A0A9P6AX56_9AGAM|nr:hypothetical protein BS47DRAFT_1056882 [Hydnum rufescens UP504]